jgi:hypothetical protein
VVNAIGETVGLKMKPGPDYPAAPTLLRKVLTALVEKDKRISQLEASPETADAVNVMATIKDAEIASLKAALAKAQQSARLSIHPLKFLRRWAAVGVVSQEGHASEAQRQDREALLKIAERAIEDLIALGNQETEPRKADRRIDAMVAL